MKDGNLPVPPTAPGDDTIELGVASVETKGTDGPGEPVGLEAGIGIAED